MSETSPETVAVPAAVRAPGAAAVEAAVRTLMRAWSPGMLLPGDPGYTAARADEDDPDEYCGCAGEDEYGDSLGCNCGDGCICDSCRYYHYTRAKTCQAHQYSAGLDAPCSEPTRYQVVGFRLVDYWTQTGDVTECQHEPGQGCPCANGVVFARYGARPRTHQMLTACSVAHAQALITRMREVYKEPADKPSRLRWYTEPWGYEPHARDLPGPLAGLRERTGSAQTWLRMAVKDHAQGKDIGQWMGYLREDLARAAWHAAQPLTLAESDDLADVWDDEVPARVQEEPDDVDGPDGGDSSDGVPEGDAS